MAKITWLGEDEGDTAGPSFTLWNNIKFPKGEAVEVSDEHMVRTAKHNRFFEVEDKAEEEPKKKPGRPKKEVSDVVRSDDED